MHTGMLWFDNNPKTTFAQKITRAIDYYKKKYGRKPELCLVHPSMATADDLSSVDHLITVRAWRPVLPGHLWIGVEDSTNLSEPKTERERDLE